MAGELAKRGGAAVAVRGGSALKKAAKKAPGKRAAGKKAAKKAPGKKGAKHERGAAKKRKGDGNPEMHHAFHHLQRAAAVISLVETESGGDLRMLLEEGVAAYRRAGKAKGVLEAYGLLRAADHLAMAGLYAARASHRLDVTEPEADEVEGLLDRVAVRLDKLGGAARIGFLGRVPALAAELLNRAEAADHDLHLAWELASAADALCRSLEGA